MDVEGDGGSFAHRHGGIAGHAGEIAAAVSVDRRDGQVAPGRHPLPVWQHLLGGTGRRRGRGVIQEKGELIKAEETEDIG